MNKNIILKGYVNISWKFPDLCEKENTSYKQLET